MKAYSWNAQTAHRQKKDKRKAQRAEKKKEWTENDVQRVHGICGGNPLGILL